MKHDFGSMVSKHMVKGDGKQIIYDCIVSYPVEGKTMLYGQILRDCMGYRGFALIILNTYDLMQRLFFDYPQSKNTDLRIDAVYSIRTLLLRYEEDFDHSHLSIVRL